MEFFRKTTTLNFMGKRWLAMSLSGLLVLTAVGSLVVRGLNFGIDFTGGTVIEVQYPQPANLSDVRGALKAKFPGAQAQHIGKASDVMIRIAPRPGETSAQLSNRVLDTLRQSNSAVKMQRVEFVGPQVGSELAEKGGLAMLYTLIGILIYVTVRFEWRLSVGSVAALVHDSLITIGVFSLFGIQFDLTVLAAVLAVIGYSLNDTVVVFDRIRENFRKKRKQSAEQIMNASINETLSRTIMTSLATLLVVLAMFFLGGPVIHGFSLALIIGIVVGTYSSIYVASAIALSLGVSKADLMKPRKEGAEAGGNP
ncbi:MAG TPA: protein translocase subunit SecF [Gammaproteobacteria bacterium]|nr:protein translocase subunit SecF [Gammaproteobacteria bacterium]